MKLPHHLLKTYRKFKEEEQNLLLWIESTASQSGYTFSSKNEKFKGRARTLARRADAANQVKGIEKSTSCEMPQTNEVTISILEILPPIAAIAKNPRVTSIPTKVVDQFNTVLDLRSACLRWFKGNTAQDDKRTRELNEKHIFPVILLKKAISILKSKFPLPATTSKRDESSSDAVPVTVQTTANLYAQLPLEESSEELSQTINEESYYVRDDPHDRLLKSLRFTKQEKLQDEFNIAKFCMLRDVQQIEDFMVLELVRYSLDQANADVLPFLSNVAIDIVAKMQSLLYNSFEWEKFETGFLNTIVLPNEHVIWSSPMLRMQNAISTQVKKKQGVPALKMFNTAGIAFNSSYPYFGASTEQQMFLEQLFVEELFRIQQEGTWENLIFYLDLVPEYVRPYASPGLGGENYYAVSAAGAFGMRIALLATVILKDQPLVSLGLLRDTGIKHARLEASREAFRKDSEYRSGLIAGLWKDRMQIMLERQKVSYTNYKNFVNDKKTALSAYHMVCTLNHVHIRMRYATTSIAAMEVCNMVKMLAQLWNLLREEEHVDLVWPDMDFLQSILGEEYLFQSTRPTSVSGDPRAIRSRILYGMGYIKEDLKKIWKSVDGINIIKSKLRLRERFSLSCYPLYTQLTRRGEVAVGTLDGAVDAELIATASVIPDMIGKKPQIVLFNTDAQIENKHTLWKLRDQGPGLQSTELLAVVKKGLQKELRMIGFDYLRFEQVTLELVATMAESLKIIQTLPAAVKSTANLVQKLRLIMFHIINNQNADLPAKVAAILKQWLPDNGHLGVKGLDVVEQRPVNPKTQLSSLRPEVLKIVQSIVKRRGLREDVFSRDQLDGTSLVVTETLDSIIQTAWTDHKIHRKTTRLESGQLTHPGLNLS